MSQTQASEQSSRVTDAPVIDSERRRQFGFNLKTSFVQEIASMANQTQTISERGSNPALGVVYICLAITIMVTNGIIILVNVKSRHLQIPTLHILTGIAVLAFVTGLHLLMYDVPLVFSPQMTCDNRFIVVGTITAGVLRTFNIFQATLAVLDRYVAVCHPLRYISIVTGRNILLAMFAYAGLCFVVMLSGLTVSWKESSTQGFHCILTFSHLYMKLLYTAFLLIVPTCVIALAYIQICREYRVRCTKPSMAYGGAPFRFPWLITCYLAWGAISYSPSFVVAIVRFAPVDSFISYGFNMLQRLSCITNIFIFIGTFKPFRKQVSRIFCHSKYIRQRRNSDIRAAVEENSHVTPRQHPSELSIILTTDSLQHPPKLSITSTKALLNI